MLTATGLELAFGPQTILNAVNLTIEQGTRAGLVGSNGSGKTSLLSILAGESKPDSGTVTRARDARLAYLPQRLPVQSDLTVGELADQGYWYEHELARERHACAETLAHHPDDRAALARLAQLDEELEHSSYHARSALIGRVLQGLGFAPADTQRPLSEFSGGWQMRASLARTLLSRSDILLLDEPTNYLDSEARIWLADALRTHPGAVILVSHDRAFLDDTVSVILELHAGRLNRYPGTYTAYERRREAELEQLLQRWKDQQREVQRQEDFIRRFRAKASKARQVQSRVKALEKVDLIEIPAHLRPVSIKPPAPPHSGSHMLELDAVTHRYDDEPVLSGVSLTLERGQRLAVVGRNGAGKTTLLRILAGDLMPSEGRLRHGTGVRIAYFAQDAADSLPPDYTVHEYLAAAAAPDATGSQVRSVLGSFLFDDDALDKPLSVLSGGERSRLVMAALLVRPVNLLILDEPTNHLDMASQRVLAEALRTYTGSLITVSHDRDFLRAVASDVLALWKPGEHSGDSWRLYPGSYREFEQSHIGEVFFSDGHADPSAGAGRNRPLRGHATDPGLMSGTKPAFDAGPSGRSQNTAGGHGAETSSGSDYQRQKEQRSEVRRLRRLEEELLERIADNESRIASLDEQMADEANYTDGDTIRTLQEQRTEAEQRLASLTAEWELVAEQLSESDNT